MLKFHLGRIPVQVNFSHLIFSAVLAIGWMPHGETGFLRTLSDPKAPGHDAATIAWVLLFVVMAFVSVLLHELGHAVVSVAFGYKPTIQLAGLGGLTRPNANESIPWFKSVALTAAGPLFGLVLALVACVVVIATPNGTTADELARTLATMNIVWSVFNLAPVYPLDGGQIAAAVLDRVFGRPGFLFAQLISLATLGLLAVVLFGVLHATSPINLLLLVFGAMSAVSNIQRYLRGELPAQPNHPSEVAYREAVEHYQAGRLGKAREASEQALTLDMTPALRSRFHYLLGWICVKEGEGRTALDHFSQVSGQKVEPQALGAAFSLIGDEQRALPLWELAWQQTNDPTILHEWAGALIRADREAEARRIRGVEMGTAYRCAERLLFIRGEFQKAAEAGLKGLAERPSANAAYDVACAFARAGDKEAAVRLLGQAAELGFRDAEYASSDSDLTTLHGHPGFAAALDAMRKSSALT